MAGLGLVHFEFYEGEVIFLAVQQISVQVVRVVSYLAHRYVVEISYKLVPRKLHQSIFLLLA